MSEQTVPIKDIVKCGDPREPAGLTAYFTFEEAAPISLCKDIPSANQILPSTTMQLGYSSPISSSLMRDMFSCLAHGSASYARSPPLDS